MDSHQQPHEAKTGTQSSQDKSANPDSTRWWDDPQTSGWDRVKEAFRRDWEQTKADFSKATGRDLKQNAGDTIEQAAGKASVPPITDKTRPATAKDARKAEMKAIEKSKDAAKKIVKAEGKVDDERAKLAKQTRESQDDVAKLKAKVDQKIAEAARKSNEKIDDADIEIDEAIAEREQATDEWLEAEREASYGFAARTQYPQFTEWNAELEGVLRHDWDEGHMGKNWEQAQPGIRRGWDFNSPLPH